MTRQEILEQVRGAVAEAVGAGRAAQVGPETDLVADLSLDSLALLELTVALENRFAVCLDEEPDASLTRVEDVVAWIAAALAEQEVSPHGLAGRTHGPDQEEATPPAVPAEPRTR